MFSQHNGVVPVRGVAKSVYSLAENALSQGLALKRWWERTDVNDRYVNKFELTRLFNEPSTSFGFFDHAAIDGRSLPIMGEVEDRYFDLPKSSEIVRFRVELRAFVLRYFMRVSDFRRPSVFIEKDGNSPSVLWPLSWCTNKVGVVEGFGYAQDWYKLHGTGELGRFSAEDAYEIVELREIGRTYEWIVARVRIFDFSFTINPFGEGRPQVVVPMDEASYIVLSPDFIVDENEPRMDEDDRTVIGRYGFGYAFIKSPDEELVGFGPGQFDVAFQQIVFRIYDNGEIRVKLVFVANRPKKIVNVPLAPLDWGLGLADAFSLGLAAPLLGPLRRTVSGKLLRPGSFDPVSVGVDLANLLTGRQAEKQLCISREQLEMAFLLKHFDQHNEMISGALQTWRQIPDWRDEAALPAWVRTGVSS